MSGGSPTAQDTAAPSTLSHHKPYSAGIIIQVLDALSAHTRQTPDYLLNLKQFPRIALEAPSSSGGKFWLGVAMDSGVSVRWGKVGTNGTVKHFALGKCQQNDPVLELKARVLAKLKKGYDIIQHETVLP